MSKQLGYVVQWDKTAPTLKLGSKTYSNLGLEEIVNTFSPYDWLDKAETTINRANLSMLLLGVSLLVLTGLKSS